MGMVRITAYGLLITLIMSFGLATDASAKSKRKKRIVQITLAPKKPSAKKKRVKREKPLVVQHRRNADAEIEPLKKDQKVSNLGIKKIWKKNKKKKRRSLASKAMKKRPAEEKTEDESKIQDSDLNDILNNMKNMSDTELASEYEGSF